jgi:hypothetical protein
MELMTAHRARVITEKANMSTTTTPSGLVAVGPFLTEAEAAHRIRRSSKTLRNWRCRSVGPAYLKVGGSVLYETDVLDDWARSQAVAVLSPEVGAANTIESI